MARKRREPKAVALAEAAKPIPASKDPLADQVKRRFARAKSKKTPWESLYDECLEYALPGKTAMFDQSEASSRTDKIFDETAVVGVQEFASRLQNGLMPNFSRFIDLRAGIDMPAEQHKEANVALDNVTAFIFEVLNGSNMAQEVSEALQDVAVGTGCLRVDLSMDPINPLRFQAVPLAKLFIDCGPDDRVDFIATPLKMHVSMIRTRYPRARLSHALYAKMEKRDGDDAACMCDLIEATWRDWTEGEETWRFVVVCDDDVLYEETYRGVGSCPFIVFRWSKMAGETWGRGPLINALPAIKTCNLTVQLILENAEMNISGMYTVEDDGVVNVDSIQILPGTVIPIAPGSQMRNLTGGGKFDVAQLVLNDMRANIKRALYNEMLGNPTGTPMSATEVSTRMAELSRQIGASFGRLQTELVEPLMRRVVYLLKQLKLITIPTVNGREVKIVAKSPLAQAQVHQDITTEAGLIQSIGGLFGPQMVNVLVKGEEVAADWASKLQIPQGHFRSEAERKQLVAMLGSAMQSMGSTPEGAMPGGGSQQLQLPAPGGARP